MSERNLQRETAIYQAALGLIAQGASPAAMKVQDIAQAAGIGKGTVYEYFTSKEEILQVNPVFTWMFRHVGVVGIERGRGDVGVVDELIGNVQKGQGLLIFPEGTRSKTGQVGKVKSGAFVIASAAGVPMVPCRIIYEPGRMKVFCRVRVCFGTPIPAEELYLGETKSASALRRNKALLTDAWQRLYDENKFD